MLWDQIADTLLSGKKRKEEIEVETESGYSQWRSELYAEIKVMVKRMNDLNLSDDGERRQFYSLTGKYAPRFQELRNRSEASNAPVQALIEIDELVETLNGISPPTSVTLSYLNPSPAQKQQQERRRKERKQRKKEQTQEYMDQIAEKLSEVNNSFDNDLYPNTT